MKKSVLFIFLAAVTVFVTACQKYHIEEQSAKPPYSLEGLTVDGQFPIVAWTGINWNETHKFRGLKDCGFNVYLDWYDNLQQVMKVLDDAEKYGIRMIVRSDTFLNDPQGEAAAMKDHPALFMYHITDEPSEGDFDWIASTVKNLRLVDKVHPWYVNLYPNWAWGGMGAYRRKLVSYFNAMPEVPFLSFDFYPVTKYGLKEGWYSNLEDIRYMSRIKKIPFWGFALSLALKENENDSDYYYPIPTVEELRLQQFVNLAYGAQGFQYWTYWGIYHSAPTIVYDRVKKVNEELQNLSVYFMNADVREVWHTGEQIPAGTKKLTALPDGVASLETSAGGAVVSYVKKDKDTYLALVNKDYKKPMALKIAFTTEAFMIDKKGFGEPAPTGEIEVAPGDIVLFQLK